MGKGTHPYCLAMNPARTRSVAPETASESRTILLVDDDTDFRVSLAEALRMEGHQVIEAPTGEAALAILDRGAKLVPPVPTFWCSTC